MGGNNDDPRSESQPGSTPSSVPGSKIKDGQNPRRKLPLIKKEEIQKKISDLNPDISLKKIDDMRFKYCDFTQKLGERLQLPQLTIASAKVFCHRFFLRHAFISKKDDNDPLVIGTACLFLAAKVEETPKPLNEVVKAAFELRQDKTGKNCSRGSIQDRETYEREKERILVAERRVLHAVEFEFSVDHPYVPLLVTIKKVASNNKKVAQAAWNMLNDSLRTLLSLQYEAFKLALAGVHVAAKFLEIKLPDEGQKYWWSNLAASYKVNVTLEEIEDISNQILDMYQVDDPKVQASGSSRDATENAPMTSNRPTGSNDNPTAPPTTSTSTPKPSGVLPLAPPPITVAARPAAPLTTAPVPGPLAPPLPPTNSHLHPSRQAGEPGSAPGTSSQAHDPYMQQQRSAGLNGGGETSNEKRDSHQFHDNKHHQSIGGPDSAVYGDVRNGEFNLLACGGSEDASNPAPSHLKRPRSPQLIDRPETGLTAKTQRLNEA
mmetsp:Transcript_30928/g.42863  ORF Transcript_30928/g.42863 Transcript_30928/m.42863 type:complete len:490 (+) Transcript_30928:261-1730(+)